ncbi:MAG: repeat-associated core domain [Acidobacteria bacterium]|nr:repeat-associated core domain [Acidobacteriota bacterium]
MITFYRSFLIVAVLVLTFPCKNLSARTTGAVNDAEVVGPSALSWNMTNHEAPFQRLLDGTHSEFAGQIVYPSGDFAFPLLQSLSYYSECNCYSLMVSTREQSPLEMVHFWRARSGFYRTANGPYLELENFDSLKAVTALNGTRFLFAQVGDGAWHCVSIHDPAGSYLLIDYRADGLIERLRDSFSRTAMLEYKEGRMVSLTQTWTTPAGASRKTVIGK